MPIENELALQRTGFYGFSFALGLYFREKNCIHLVCNANKFIVIISFFLSIIAVLWFNDRDMNWLLFGNHPYSEWPIMYGLCPLVRIAQILLSLLASIVFIKCCPVGNILATIGMNTLFIYIYHSFVISALKNIYFNYNDLTILLISLVVTFISLYVFNKIPLLHHLINPIKSLQIIKRKCLK